MKSSERSDSAGLLQVEALPHDAAESALSIATFADTLYVLFGGRSADAGRIVDRYDLRQSRYIGSLRLPGSASRMAVPAADLLVLADELDGFRRIVALRVRESR